MTRFTPSRRRVLQGAGAMALAAAVPGGRRAVAAAGGMTTRAIPASGEEVPVIGLGTARTFNVSPAGDLAPQRGVLEAFHAEGGRLVDTSPMYGRAEDVVGKLAADLGITGDLFMATKVWTNGEQAGIEQMQRSEERLGVERLDLNQVHNLRDLRTHLNTLKRWREDGRVRYIGVTHYTDSAHDDLARVVREEPIDFVQFNYNIAARNAEAELLPAVADKGVATLINEPFESGRLFSRVGNRSVPEWMRDELGIESWAQVFLTFIAGHPAVTCAIPATSDPEHARDNTRAGHGPMPDAKQRQRMAKAFEAPN
ncbi:Aldo/keto reductase [Limimonas halophila]|uniref:Aldo/keto reductase n=1 Tax=Limimonas halophila TaxID=1082479 RepID=A0A1G7SQH3_9PROT|nr:aldo/keto reductase [Limimonas halophila]SDG25218.1 Aldo/keto reductase [Limimonas halophila]